MPLPLSLASFRRAKSRSISPLFSYPYKLPISQLPRFDMLAKYLGGIPPATANRRPPVLDNQIVTQSSPARLTEGHAAAHWRAVSSYLPKITLTPPPPPCKLMMLDEVTGGVCRASKLMCAGPEAKAMIRRRLDCRKDSSRTDRQRGTSYLSAAGQYLAVKSQVACARVWRYGSGHKYSPLTLETGGGILGTGS